MVGGWGGGSTWWVGGVGSTWWVGGVGVVHVGWKGWG